MLLLNTTWQTKWHLLKNAKNTNNEKLTVVCCFVAFVAFVASFMASSFMASCKTYDIVRSDMQWIEKCTEYELV